MLPSMMPCFIRTKPLIENAMMHVYSNCYFLIKERQIANKLERDGTSFNSRSLGSSPFDFFSGSSFSSSMWAPLLSFLLMYSLHSKHCILEISSFPLVFPNFPFFFLDFTTKAWDFSFYLVSSFAFILVSSKIHSAHSSSKVVTFHE